MGGSEMSHPVDAELIAAKSALIVQNLEQPRRLSKVPIGRFRADAAERLLHVSIQATVDIRSHLISAERLSKPGQYAEMPLMLREAGVVFKGLAGALISMMCFRNMLAHLYAKVDADRVHQMLQSNLNDFERFEGEIVRHPRQVP